MPRARRLAAGLGLVLLLLIALAAAHGPLLRAIGGYLIARDPLVHADAIVVLAGGHPAREIAAAALFREGWAPRVILTRATTPSHVEALLRLGIRAHDFQGEARLALEKSGVPAAAIVTLDEPARITEAELRIVHRFAREHGYRRVILVSSAEHLRRVRLIWARQSGDAIEGLTWPVPDDDFTPDSWWRDRRLAEAALHEYLGIIAVTLGISELLR